MAIAPQPPIGIDEIVGVLTTLDQSIELELHSVSTGTLQITGTWVGEISLEVSNDNFTNTFPAFFSSGTFGVVTSTTINGNFRLFGVAGYKKIRAKMTSYTSGTANIAISTSLGNSTQITGVQGLFPPDITPLFLNPVPIGGTDDGGILRISKYTSGGEVKVKHIDAIPITDNAGSITIDGTITANAGSNLNTSALSLETTSTAIKNALETIDNAISGSEMQVDIVTLPSVAINNFPSTQAVSGTVTANAGTGVFDITPASPAATDYLPVRLTDGLGFYVPGTPVSQPIYIFNIPSSVHVAAASTLFVDLFNADATKVVRIKLIQHIVNLAIGVTGVGFAWQLLRTTSAGTGGTAQTAWLPDTTQASLDVDITCRLKATGGATASTSLKNYYINSEETLAGNQLLGGLLDTNIIPEILRTDGIVLRQNQGIRINQETNSAAGNTAWLIGFTVE